MNADKTVSDTSTEKGPLQDFSNCHVGILRQLERLRDLPGKVSEGGNDQEVRKTASEMLRFFQEAVFQHHADEEEELFPAVKRCAKPGEEAAKVDAKIQRLIGEHRSVEKLWKSIEGSVKRLAKGKQAELDAALTERLLESYMVHARYEEQEFLPLSAKVLDKNNQSALGLSLHIRHANVKTPKYI